MLCMPKKSPHSCVRWAQGQGGDTETHRRGNTEKHNGGTPKCTETHRGATDTYRGEDTEIHRGAGLPNMIFNERKFALEPLNSVKVKVTMIKSRNSLNLPEFLDDFWDC